MNAAASRRLPRRTTQTHGTSFRSQHESLNLAHSSGNILRFPNEVLPHAGGLVRLRALCGVVCFCTPRCLGAHRTTESTPARRAAPSCATQVSSCIPTRPLLLLVWSREADARRSESSRGAVSDQRRRAPAGEERRRRPLRRPPGLRSECHVGCHCVLRGRHRRECASGRAARPVLTFFSHRRRSEVPSHRGARAWPLAQSEACW